MNPISYNDIYYVDAPVKSRLNPVAIKPLIYPDHMVWGDTSRGGEVSIAQILECSPQKISVMTKSGEKIIFLKLDLKLYNEKVREWVWDQPNFKSDLELKDYYMNMNFEP